MNADAAARHTFHVPVMGIGFTIDTPIRLAPLGLDSAISLVNQDALEAARAKHCRLRLLPYEHIPSESTDARARRITAYLNLVDELVRKDLERIRQSSFEDPGGISRYFRLLPSASPSRQRYDAAQALPDGEERDRARAALRALVVPGTIGVNIMTKVDGSLDAKGESRGEHGSEAQSALRGFAESTLAGTLILSAGANPGLFAYLSQFDDFFPDASGIVKKTITLKVSDFRSAHVQGRMLARRGLWVSEYRIESGLNCGGHAFPTEGVLMGPILAEFQSRRAELSEGLFDAYKKGLLARGLGEPASVPQVCISAQGGIGTALEDQFLREHFGLDKTGWGSPFLMVPEVVTLDEPTLTSLVKAKKEDIALSWSSPLGVRFWWLKTCASEVARVERIKSGHPGSVCTARHLALNTEYGKIPLCPGSRAYQKRKKAELDPNHPDYDLLVERLQAPACICVDLTGSYLASTDEAASTPPPAICPGPNIINFQAERSLEEMVDHIYGRANILTRSDRPHMFAREAQLYLEIMDEELGLLGTALAVRKEKDLSKTLDGLQAGFDFYRGMAPALPELDRDAFVQQLDELQAAVLARRGALEERQLRADSLMATDAVTPALSSAVNGALNGAAPAVLSHAAGNATYGAESPGRT